MTKIYLVRHAEAAGNKQRFFQGHMDGRVSEKGYIQISLLAKRFKSIRLDAIYSSPLSRAVETAKGVNSGSGLEIITDERLMEINGGVFEGVAWAELPVRFPEMAESWSLRPWEFAPENGEAMSEVMDRMVQALRDIGKRHEGGTVGIVSHGCAIRALMCQVLYGDILKLNDVDWCDNTGITTLIWADGTLRAEQINDNSHLDESTSTFAGQKWWRPEARENPVYDD